MQRAAGSVEQLRAVLVEAEALGQVGTEILAMGRHFIGPDQPDGIASRQLDPAVARVGKAPSPIGQNVLAALAESRRQETQCQLLRLPILAQCGSQCAGHEHGGGSAVREVLALAAHLDPGEAGGQFARHPAQVERESLTRRTARGANARDHRMREAFTDPGLQRTQADRTGQPVLEFRQRQRFGTLQPRSVDRLSTGHSSQRIVDRGLDHTGIGDHILRPSVQRETRIGQMGTQHRAPITKRVGGHSAGSRQREQCHRD